MGEISNSIALVDEAENALRGDCVVYKVVENISYSNTRLIIQSQRFSGLSQHYFVFKKENEDWKIERVSANASDEKLARSSLSCPSNITVYFTKAANYNYYGVKTKSLTFSTYLTNVLPQEWIISYYGSYPQYGYASALASKMYGWYCTVNPKFDYDPYFADVKDDSSDQNFLYNSRSSLASVYRNYLDSVLSYIDRLAMVESSTNSIFEVHYYASSGTQYSGKMNAAECLSKAKNGETYSAILHYYYDYSTYIGTSKQISIVSY